MSSGSLAHAQDIDACIGASEKAVSLRKADRLIAARASLSACASPACPDAIRKSCVQRLAEANRAIPSIVLLTKDGNGHDLAAVKLSIDGAPYADRLDGNAIVLDPGEHEFRFETPGQAPVVQRFVLHQGEQNRRETILIGPPALTAPAPSPHPDTTSDDGRSDKSLWRTVGLVVGGVGVAGLVAGGVFGALALSAHDGYEKSCGSNIGAPAGLCNQSGVNGEADAATKGTVSTVAFVVGGAAVAAGTALFLLAPKGARLQVGLGPGSVIFSGGF